MALTGSTRRIDAREAAERDRLLAELAASEARFLSIIERTADGIVIVGGDRKVRFVNRAAEQLFGRGADALVGQDFGLAVVAGDTTEMDIVRQGSAEPAIAELRVSDTTWEGEPAQLISLRDITDRKRAEERAQGLLLEQAAREEAERAERRASFLAEAGARLDASLDPEVTLVSLSDLIVPGMADWCVIDLVAGETVRRICGVHADPGRLSLLAELAHRYPPAPGSVQPSASVFRTGVAELHREIDGDRLRALTVDEGHAQLLLALGVRSSITVPLRARHGLLGTMTMVRAGRDFDGSDLELAGEVADRAGQALENARLYEAAVAANKARSDFLAVVSHELRTPLNVILGYTQLLLGGVTGEPDDVQGEHIRRIDSSAQHLLRIIQKILAFASMEADRVEARPEPARVGDVMEDIASVAAPLAADRGLEFGLHVSDADAALFVDVDKLRQVTFDLLTNAAKFTRRGRIDLVASLDAGDIVIDVRDTGTGIAPEHIDRIFEPFWQAEDSLTREHGGIGLGLTVSKRLAHLLGGDVTVDSTPGRGSTFTLRVPAGITTGGRGAR